MCGHCKTQDSKECRNNGRNVESSNVVFPSSIPFVRNLHPMQDGKISRSPLPDAPNRIKVTTDGDNTTEEGGLRADILKQIDTNRFAQHQAVIGKGDADGIGTLDSILDDCNDLVGFAEGLKKGDWGYSSFSQFEMPKRDQLVRQLVQQLYNTLSQVSLAMDIVKKPKSTNNDISALAKTPWVKCRNKFNTVVKKLATLAHNPAIAVLIYEGTYYPTQYSSKTLKATRNAVGDNKKGSIDTAELLFYGAVCNNAAYGSVFAAGTQYQSQSGGAARPVLGLSRGDRAPWKEYNLQGKGVGNDALDGAKQGDIMIFWHFSKLDDATIAGREKQHHRDIKKEMTATQGLLSEAKKAAEKGSDDKWIDYFLQARVDLLELTQAGQRIEDERITALFSQLREKKAAYAAAEKAKSQAEGVRNKASKALGSADKAVHDAESALDRALKRIDKAKSEKEKEAAEKDFDKKMEAWFKAVEKQEAAEYNLADEDSHVDDAGSVSDSALDEYADLIVAADMNAHHTEVIVGVDDESKQYLLSGAHGSNFVNGIAREKNKLAWKDAEGIRHNRIMRRIPMNNESDFIAVNIPAVMKQQGYDVSKVNQKNREKNEEKQEGALESEFAVGSYETKTGNVPVYFNSNTADSVAIKWIGKHMSLLK